MGRRFRIVKVDLEHAGRREQLAAMHDECFPEFEQVEPWGDWWFVFEAGGDKPVGFAGLWRSQRAEGAGYLARAGVLPKARGRGLQKRLIQVREREARRKRWTVLFSDTYPGNPHSLNNLFACGFRAFTPTEPWCGGDWIYLKKIITEGVG